jgi:hypothetical protein
MRVRHFAIILVPAAAMLSACSELPLACTSIPRPAVRAGISDSATGLSAAYTSSLILQNDAVYDSSFFADDIGLTAESDAGAPVEVTSRANEPGVYSVRVRRSGYELWSRGGVQVKAERCGAEATHLDVRLQRAP